MAREYYRKGIIEHDGFEGTLAQHAKRLGLPYNIAYARWRARGNFDLAPKPPVGPLVMLTIRCSPELAERAKNAAHDSRQSLNQFMVAALSDAAGDA